MAITKTYLNGKYPELKLWLETLGLFASVDLNDESTPSSVSCRDENGTELLTISNSGNTYTVRAYVNNGKSWYSASYTSNNPRFTYGYACKNGGMLYFLPDAAGYENMCAHVLLTRTNNGKVAVIFSSAQGVYADATGSLTSYYAVTLADVTPVSIQTMHSNRNMHQTQLVPFCTNCALGVDSYTPDAFFLPVSQYQENVEYKELAADGVSYLTNGFWAIRDA